MTDHLHNYGDPLSAAEPHKRRCSACGEPQVYRAPVGQGEFPYVMMVRKDTLRHLLDIAEPDRYSAFAHTAEQSDAIREVERMLD